VSAAVGRPIALAASSGERTPRTQPRAVPTAGYTPHATGARITGNVIAGLSVIGAAGQSQVTAVGDTWRARVQGSDGSGHDGYDIAASLNFGVAGGCSVAR
jgi:hypothetical protein